MQNPAVQLKNAFGTGSSAFFKNLYNTMADNNISALQYTATFQSVQMTQTTSIDALGRSVTTTQMSMQEYQVYIAAKIDDIPFHATRPFDEQAINISDAGWLKMKNDPEHENFVLEAIRASRQLIDDLFNQGSVGNFSVLNFDDTKNVDSHTFSKQFGGSLESARSIFEYESWNAFWISRAERAEQLEQSQEAAERTDALLEMLAENNKLPTV